MGFWKTSLRAVGIAALVGGLGLTAGCPREEQSAGEKTEEAAEETGEAIEEGAEETGEAVEEGAEETGEAVDEATE